MMEAKFSYLALLRNEIKKKAWKCFFIMPSHRGSYEKKDISMLS